MSIRVENITKIYGQQKALDDVSFEIQSADVVGFLGPNGAGKSTMMKIITGFIPPNHGKVFINDVDIETNPVEIRKDIGYLPEHNPLYLDMYVKESLEFTARIFKLSDVNKRIGEMIERTGLTIEQNKKIGALSKGYRQRVGLAQALIHNPKILILDEPTTGLDPNQIIEIRNLISEIGREKTVMLSTHIMQEVEAICDKIIIVNHGKIVADGDRNSIQGRQKEKTQTIQAEFKETIDVEKLKSLERVSKVAHVKDNIFLIESKLDEDIRGDIFNFAVANNYTVLSIQEKKDSLETIFQELTK